MSHRASSPAPNGSPARNSCLGSLGTPDQYSFHGSCAGDDVGTDFGRPSLHSRLYRETIGDPSARAPALLHCTSSTRPSTNTQLAAPRIEITPVITKAHTKFPVRSTANPVTAGAATPAKFPTKFCKPVHFPAARGPASVCVIAQMFDAFIPKAALATSRN